jgi:hypothetical protein
VNPLMRPLVQSYVSLLMFHNRSPLLFCVLAVCGSPCRTQLSFVDKIVAIGSSFPHTTAADVFKALGRSSTLSACVDAAVASPKEFYQIFTLFHPAFATLAESSPAFAALVEFLVAVGKQVSSKDANLAARLFRDFALPSLCPLIEARPTKRHAAMRLLYACAAPTPTGHLQVCGAVCLLLSVFGFIVRVAPISQAIRILQQALDSLQVFGHCLSILVFIEDAFNVRGH